MEWRNRGTAGDLGCGQCIPGAVGPQPGQGRHSQGTQEAVVAHMGFYWRLLGAVEMWCACGVQRSPGRSSDNAIEALDPTFPARDAAAEGEGVLQGLPWGWRPGSDVAVPWSCRDRVKMNRGHTVAVPRLCPPSASAKMTAALKVSPAPSVSTRVSGGKASECTSCPSGPKASAPSSAQAQISVALRECQVGLGNTLCSPAPLRCPPTLAGRAPAAPSRPRRRIGTRSAEPGPC